MRNQLKLADTYYRLSDEEKKRGESSSIGNQRQLVESYCQRNNIVIVREFVDDGYSGGNFDRPGFQALLTHLKSGKANMVITKDLSRLGRDMSESSYYAERYFPELGIHYIAPEDNFDSMRDNMMAPFQFAMNDVYLRDTSRKVKAVLELKRKSGKYAACPPFGYKKVPGTTDLLTPDENTAPIVKKIFALAARGQSARAIAIQLNQDGDIPPLKYRVTFRDVFSDRGAARASDVWNYTTVKRILRNRVYLGHTILGKTRKASVKSPKKLPVPIEDWCITENTHEALVSKQEFDAAAHFLSENTKSNAANPRFRHSIFGGIAYCAHCGAAMCSGGSVYKGEREKYWYLVCNNLASRAVNRCSHGARIKYEDLLEIVRRDLNQMISFSEQQIKEITNAAVAQAQDAEGWESAEKRLERIDAKLAALHKMIERLYRDNAAGYITDEQVDAMMKKFSDETKELAAQQQDLLAGESKTDKIKNAYDVFFALAKNYGSVDKLDRAILHTFIERIEIGEKILPEGKQIAGPRTPYRQSIRIFYRFIGDASKDPVFEVNKKSGAEFG